MVMINLYLSHLVRISMVDIICVNCLKRGPGWLNELGSWIITNTAWVRTRLCKLQKRVYSTYSCKW